MLLTGKAKEYFEKWARYDKYTEAKIDSNLVNCNFNSEYYKKITKNSLIIEWLDSVGIYITPQIDYQLNFYCRLLLDKKEETPTVIIGHDFKSRSGAIEDGIKKANKIYNER